MLKFSNARDLGSIVKPKYFLFYRPHSVNQLLSLNLSSYDVVGEWLTTECQIIVKCNEHQRCTETNNNYNILKPSHHIAAMFTFKQKFMFG